MERPVAVKSFFRELTQTGIYKRSQGRITRQVTFAAMALVIALGLWRLSVTLKNWDLGFGDSEAMKAALQFGLPGLLLAIGWWITYRLVNLPAFADFLIAVEAEMNKVSWPTRTELFRASMVVLATIFILATVLFGYDLFWKTAFEWIGL